MRFKRFGALVVIFSWALVIWGPPNIAIFLFLGAPRSALAVALPTVCVAAVPWILRRTSSLQLTVAVKLGSLLLCLLIVALYGRGVTSAAGPWHIAIPMFAMLMAGARSALLWGVLSLVQLLAIHIVFNYFDLAPPAEVAHESEGSLLAAHLAMVLLLVFLVTVIFDSMRAEAMRALEAARERINRAHRGARLVLDNIQEGLVLVDLSGRIVGEHSAIMEQWFDTPHLGQMLWEVMETRDPDGAVYMMMGFDELSADILPMELCLDQLPRRVRSGTRHLDVRYWQVSSTQETAKTDRLLVAFTDITAQLDAETAQQQQGDMVALTAMYLRDRRGLVQYLEDTVELVASLRSQPEAQFRALHTIKGNSAVCGLHYLAHVCHLLEDELQGHAGPTLSSAAINQVEDAFQAAASDFLAIASRDDANSLYLSSERYLWLLRQLDTCAPHDATAFAVRKWRESPIRPQLERLAAQASRLSRSLHNSDLMITIEDGDVVVPPEFGRGVWSSLIHLIRNAVDHGIEQPVERAQKGKPSQGRLSLEARYHTGYVEIEIRDDGRGIDWELLRARAVTQGIDLDQYASADLLFLDGLSTRSEVSDVSGRGVGMSAVRAAIVEAGGEILVESERDQGTRFLCRLPRRSTLPSARPSTRPVAGIRGRK